MKTTFVAALVLIGSVAAVQGQETERRRGFGTIPLLQSSTPEARWMLLRLPPVQQELSLTDEAITKIRESYDDKLDTLRASRGGNRESFADLRREFAEQAKKLLDEQQQERLLQIYLQALDVRAILQPDVAEKLQFSDEQKDKLKELAGRTGFGRGRDSQTGQPTYAKNEEIAAILTAEQKERFEKMKGEKFDVAQLVQQRERRTSNNDTKAKTQWEYRVEHGSGVNLQKLGEEGWELVAVLPEVARADSSRGGGGRSEKEFYFKRIKQ